MAETNLSNPFNFNRRQLLASAAAAATAGIVPGVDRAGANKPAEATTGHRLQDSAEADAEEFRRFKAVHAKAVWNEVVETVRRETGDPNWKPRSWANGMWCHFKVDEILRQRYRAAS